MITVKINTRGQITIPRNIRKQVGLEPGDSIAVIPHGDQVVLQPVTQTLIDLRGSVPVTDVQDYGAIRQQVMSARGKVVGDHER